ncbi:putative vps51 vps67 protein [Erysiphe neolycopersici]|uniref:Vacuolar protein sorting-associated protein 51 homolog n=1 Tax=Erysiphe neolycopersici TaxID=212602 RepID=A0A420HQC5_9PEZI|nr:putative vps51 vps67 protein [Erysiphe neolycopersici]
MSSTRNSSLMGRRTPTMPLQLTTGSGTPTSSSGRPSIDYYSSNNPLTSDAYPMTSNSSRRSSITTTSRLNRVALREYYNLKGGGPGESSRATTTTAASNATHTTATTLDKADDLAQINTETDSMISFLPDHMPYEPSELDQPNLDVQAFVKRVLEGQTLFELLATYNSLLGEIRALDSEQKALVYDNYSKLITATETIARMRCSVERGEEPTITGTLSVAIDDIFSKAEVLKENIDKVSGSILEKPKAEEIMRKIKARNVARRVLDTPEKVRNLVKEGNRDEAQKIWEEVKIILLTWKERGVGGPDVIDCLEDGERALMGELPTEKSWINIKNKSNGS